MKINLPEIFTAETSKKYILSIRLYAGGLSFSGSIPKEKNSFFYRETTFDKLKDYESSIKEFFFENECFCWVYKKINIVCFTHKYTFMPEDIFDSGKIDSVMNFLFMKAETKNLDNVLQSVSGRILFGLDKSVYEFMSRSFVNPSFIHHMTPIINLWAKQANESLSGKMYVSINKKTIDVACFKEEKLVFLNSFEYSKPDDVLYIIACIWTQTRLDQLKDNLFIGGNYSFLKTLTDNLRTYIQHVNTMELPSEAYLMGDDVAKANFDIIALSLCE